MCLIVKCKIHDFCKAQVEHAAESRQCIVYHGYACIHSKLVKAYKETTNIPMVDVSVC